MERLPRPLRIHHRTTGERLHNRGIPSRDIRKSIPSLGALKGEARILVSQLVNLGYKDGIDIDQIESLPPEFSGIRHWGVVLRKETPHVKLKDIVIQEIFSRYSGAGLTMERKFQKRMIRAVDENLKGQQEK